MQPCHSNLCTNNGRNSTVFVWLRTDSLKPLSLLRIHSSLPHLENEASPDPDGRSKVHPPPQEVSPIQQLSLLSLHNSANTLNPPWNALSSTYQHVRVCSVLCSILIRPIERWQLSVSQTFTWPLWLQLGLELRQLCWRSRALRQTLKYTHAAKAPYPEV